MVKQFYVHIKWKSVLCLDDETLFNLNVRFYFQQNNKNMDPVLQSALTDRLHFKVLSQKKNDFQHFVKNKTTVFQKRLIFCHSFEFLSAQTSEGTFHSERRIITQKFNLLLT